MDRDFSPPLESVPISRSRYEDRMKAHILTQAGNEIDCNFTVHEMEHQMQPKRTLHTSSARSVQYWSLIFSIFSWSGKIYGKTIISNSHAINYKQMFFKKKKQKGIHQDIWYFISLEGWKLMYKYLIYLVVKDL